MIYLNVMNERKNILKLEKENEQGLVNLMMHSDLVQLQYNY